MQKLSQFWRKNRVYLMGTTLIIGLVIVFKPLHSIKFYGFEYEDSFISAHVASQANLAPFVKDFRTHGCESRVNGECISVSSYTGHYITYSAYLFSVAKILNIKKQYLIHKFGNAILFGLCFLVVFIFYKDDFVGVTFMVVFISSLPVLYVFNSGLIENLSFCLALIFIISLHQYLLKNMKWWLWTALLLLIILVIVKRENLIYLSTLILINPKYLIRKYTFWIFALFLILTQFAINPFYTEGLEASYLGRSTFSVDYFIFQFPTYLKAFFRFDGFFILLIFILLARRPSKKSGILILIWFSFILLYSFHYRGQYAIEAGEITHFESFRYMFNTTPLLIGYMIFGKRNNQMFQKIAFSCIIIGCSVLIFKNIDMLKEFGREEYAEYHSINDKIDALSDRGKRIALHDNFVLISMLNSNSESIDIFSAQKNFLEFHLDQENILINRFDIIDIDAFNNDYEFEEIESLSSKGVKVYSFKECF